MSSEALLGVLEALLSRPMGGTPPLIRFVMLMFVEVPFSEHASAVAGILKDLGDGNFL